jgi:hypothetical protein
MKWSIDECFAPENYQWNDEMEEVWKHESDVSDDLVQISW